MVEVYKINTQEECIKLKHRMSGSSSAQGEVYKIIRSTNAVYRQIN